MSSITNWFAFSINMAMKKSLHKWSWLQLSIEIFVVLQITKRARWGYVQICFKCRFLVVTFCATWAFVFPLLTDKNRISPQDNKTLQWVTGIDWRMKQILTASPFSNTLVYQVWQTLPVVFNIFQRFLETVLYTVQTPPFALSFF